MTIEERAKEKLNSDGWWGLYGRTKLVDTYIQGATDQDPISRAEQKKIDIEKARRKFCELCTDSTWECPRNCYRLQKLQKAMEE